MIGRSVAGDNRKFASDRLIWRMRKQMIPSIQPLLGAIQQRAKGKQAVADQPNESEQLSKTELSALVEQFRQAVNQMPLT